MNKKINYHSNAFVWAISFALLTQLTSCGKKEVVPLTTVIQNKLIANPWKMQSVSVDGVDQTTIYKGLTLTFTKTSFNSINGGVVWPVSGQWTFTSADATTIKRDDGILVNVEITNTSLRLTLTWAKTILDGGRVTSLKGKNIFTLIK